MKYVNGLAILRRISPPRALEDFLDAEGQLIAIDSGSGRDRRTYICVDDDVPRDEAHSIAITGRPNKEGSMVGGCTDGWILVDADGNVRGQFSSALRAEKARAGAKVTIITDVELEDEEAERSRKSKPATEAVATAA